MDRESIDTTTNVQHVGSTSYANPDFHIFKLKLMKSSEHSNSNNYSESLNKSSIKSKWEELAPRKRINVNN